MSIDEATKMDVAASAACTRAGTFALLLSLFLLALIPFWEQEREEIALGQYLALRLNLAISINQLDDNPYWQQYKTSHEAAESTSIEHLLMVRVNAPSGKSHVAKAQPTPSKSVENKTKQDATLVPAPPGPIHFSIEIDTIHQIANYLRRLNDSKLLTKSRKVSDFHDYSIYSWAYKRNRLFWQNFLAEHPNTVLAPNIGDRKENTGTFVPALDEEQMLKYLTLHDVRELAQYELPKLTDPIKLGRRYGSWGPVKEIEMVPGSLPPNLYVAAIFADTLLLFVVMYFFAFTREAVSSAKFPAPGTLFSAFSRSPSTLAAFLIALWSPVVTSLGVAVASRKLPLIVCSVLIGCAVLSVHLTYKRKSYFTALNFRFLLSSKPPEKNVISRNLQENNQNPDSSMSLPNKPDAGDA